MKRKKFPVTMSSRYKPLYNTAYRVAYGAFVNQSAGNYPSIWRRLNQVIQLAGSDAFEDAKEATNKKRKKLGLPLLNSRKKKRRR